MKGLLYIFIAGLILFFLYRMARLVLLWKMRRRATRWSESMGPREFGPVKRKPLEGLDGFGFEPTATEEMRGFARTFGGGWLRGRWEPRDRIPSAGTPRTRLVDRAMIGLGLITQEDLEEAHRLGEVVDRAHGDERLARELAEGEAFTSLEGRKTLKEQKKAEAAKRREEHARQVAQRRKTDIVFLGRGVSKGLADRRANVEKLEAAGLPVMATPKDVAAAMGISIPHLRWLAYHSEASPLTHYVRFTVPKKSGGSRVLSAPHRDIATAQRWILEHILGKLPVHPAAHGFIPARSTVTNAAPHVGQAIVINVDLQDFFPSVSFPRVSGIFRSMGYSPAASVILALLCTESPRRTVQYEDSTYHVACGPRALPQGACTSPVLSNLVTRKLDARLSGFCAKLGWTYTRYADDMTFSAGGEASKHAGYLLARVRHVVQEEGFNLNEKKTRVLKRSTAQTVTGIVVNDKPAVSRKEIRRIRAILHNAKTRGLASQNRENRPNFEGWLTGKIAYISMISPEKGKALRSDLERIIRC